MKHTLLVSMDNVLADLEQGFLIAWRSQYPDQPFIPLEKRFGISIQDDYQRRFGLGEKARSIIEERHFFLELPPIDGSIQAMKSLKAFGWDILVCTSSIGSYQYCVSEKYLWLAHHLGYPFFRYVNLASDRTSLVGRFLIDDNPNVTGEYQPKWEQLLFDAPHNLSVAGHRRINWKNYHWLLDASVLNS